MKASNILTVGVVGLRAIPRVLLSITRMRLLGGWRIAAAAACEVLGFELEKIGFVKKLMMFDA